MGAKLSVTSPTQEQFNGVSQICLRNDNTGLIMELHLDEERWNADRTARGWYDCDTALNIAVRKTKCVDFRKCQANLEGHSDFRVTLKQATIDGDTEVYEEKFTYAEFGKTVNFQITGSTVQNAKGKVTSTSSRSPPSDKCLGDSCYVAPNTRRFWQGAQEYCTARDGHLAYIGSQEENDIVQHTLNDAFNSYNTAWVGLQAQNGEFAAWEDGSEVVYENWSPGEPNLDGNGDVGVEMKSNGKWNDLGKENGIRFVCEIPKNLIGNHQYN